MMKLLSDLELSREMIFQLTWAASGFMIALVIIPLIAYVFKECGKHKIAKTIEQHIIPLVAVFIAILIILAGLLAGYVGVIHTLLGY